MSSSKVMIGLALALGLALLDGAAARTARAEGDSPRSGAVRVLAAASLTEVVEGLARDFAGGRVQTSFGASSDLARQIRDGLPADVFVSASQEWIEFLREADRLDGEPVRVARNALVCAVAAQSGLKDLGISGLRDLLGAIGPGDLVAIADDGVPAGDYARRALAKLGLAAAYAPRLVGQRDVRAVLHAVEQGEVVAGFVYATDVRIARVATLFTFDPTTHPPIEYHAVVLRDASNEAAARRFVEHLGSPAARSRLSAAGFVLP